MDILKIRQRAQRDKAAQAERGEGASQPAATAKGEAERGPAPPASATAKPPKPSVAGLLAEEPGGYDDVHFDEAATLPPGPALPPLPPLEPEERPAPRAVRPAARSQSTAPPRTRPVVPEEAYLSDPLRLADPLGEFLARYEPEDEDDDVYRSDELRVEQRKRFLSFNLAGEGFAVSILEVREILKAVAVTHVPRAPLGVLGVLSKRGVVMPVIDLAAIIGLREPDGTLRPGQRILTVGRAGRTCGLRVDVVSGVVAISPDAIGPVPAGLDAKTISLLAGLARTDSRYLTVLDIDAVLDYLLVHAGHTSRAS